jgi:mRNA interferase ChpB
MVRRLKFDRGDIVRVNLNPTAGREQQGDFRPALVLSPAAFNTLGVALLSGSGTETQGVALVNMIRTLDLEARGAKRVERAPPEVVDDALARLQTILE